LICIITLAKAEARKPETEKTQTFIVSEEEYNILKALVKSWGCEFVNVPDNINLSSTGGSRKSNQRSNRGGI
jgi:hypothetical protein